MADIYRLRIYRTDGTLLAEFGTDPAHPQPWLEIPERLPTREVQLAEGRARISSTVVTLGDVPTQADDQDSGGVTALLADASGRSQLMGLRAHLERFLDPTWETVQNGPLDDIAQGDDFVSYQLTIKDQGEQERRTKAFIRATTSTVWPRGVLNGFGRLPDGTQLVKPTKPLRAVFRDAPVPYFDLSGLWQNYPGEDAWVHPELVITEKMRKALRQVVEPGEPFEQEVQDDLGQVYTQTVTPYRVSYPDVAVCWRILPTDPWTVLEAPEAFQNLVVEGKARLSSEKGAEVRAGLRIQLVAAATAGWNLPDGTAVEVLLRYNSEPTEDFPLHVDDTTFGQFLVDLGSGAKSPADTQPFLVDTAAALAFTEPMLARIKEPLTGKDGVWKWLEENWCRPLGAAFGRNSTGALKPVRWKLPSVTDPLLELDDTNCEPTAGWRQGSSDAVNVVEGEYPRLYLVGDHRDPLGENSAGDGLAEKVVRVRFPHIEGIRRMGGERVLKIKSSTLAALGGIEGVSIVGDVSNERGARMIHARSIEALDRFLLGGQHFSLTVSRAALQNHGEGDWAIVGVSWAPDYQTGRMGASRLAQVVRIHPLDSLMAEVELVDAGPDAQPLPSPSLGTPVLTAEGRVRVTVSDLAAGALGRVDYATGNAQPAVDSGTWRLAGRTEQDGGAVETPPIGSGVVVWLRPRAEAPGRRPSAWGNVVSLGTGTTARLLEFRLEIRDGKLFAVWSANSSTLGVRVAYEAHAAGVSPTYPAFVDADATLGSVELPVDLGAAAGLLVSARATPYTAWTGSAVSGTPGDPLEAQVFAAAMAGGTFDLVVDAVTGQVYVTPNAIAVEARSWRFQLTVGSVQTDAFTPPAFVDAPGDLEFSGATSGERVDTGVALATGEAAYLVGYWFSTPDATAAAQLAAARSRQTRAWLPKGAAGPDVTPTLDEDAAALYLYPNRNTLAASVRWVTRTDRAPTLAEVQAGAVSTAESILAHTFTATGEQAWVGVLPYSGADGTGTEGPLRVRQRSFNTANDLPGMTWQPVPGTNPDMEAVELTATDDSDQVALFFRTYSTGAVPPAYTRVPVSGFSADPLVHRVEVPVPAIASPDLLLEAYAQDAEGNSSARVALRIDPGTHPSGTFQLQTDGLGRVWLTANTQDPDAGSWRARVHLSDVELYPGVQYALANDGTTWEGAGSAWGERVDTGLVVQGGQEAFLSGHFYRTTDISNAAQQASRRSPEVRTWSGVYDPEALAFLDFKEIRRTATHVTFGWVSGSAMAEAWIYSMEYTHPVPSQPWNVAREPDETLPASVVEYTVELPASGRDLYLQFEARDSQARAGQVRRVILHGLAGSPPEILAVDQAPATGANTTHVVAISRDAAGRPGTWRAWVNRLGTDDANRAAAPDGTLEVPGPGVVDRTAIWTLTGGGTAALFSELPVHAQRGKRIFLEYIASDGTTTGVRDFQLHSWTSILDANTGGLLNEIVGQAAIQQRAIGTFQLALNAVQHANIASGAIDKAKLAAGFDLVAVSTAASLPTTKTAELLAWGGKVYRWSGTAYTSAIPAVDISASVRQAIQDAGKIRQTEIADNAIGTPQLIAGSVTSAVVYAGTVQALKIQTVNLAAQAVTADILAATSVVAGKIAAGAINTATLIVDGVITAAKLAVGQLSEIANDVGIIVSGQLRNAAGTRYIDLDATGTQPFIAHNKFTLYANGNAAFSGTITAGSIIAPQVVITTQHLEDGIIKEARLMVDGIIQARHVQIAKLSDFKKGGGTTGDPVGLGIIVEGVLKNSSSTAGIRLSSADGAIPASWRTYLDLAATSAAPVLYHSDPATGRMRFQLLANGEADFAGDLRLRTDEDVAVRFLDSTGAEFSKLEAYAGPNGRTVQLVHQGQILFMVRDPQYPGMLGADWEVTGNLTIRGARQVVTVTQSATRPTNPVEGMLWVV